jgi:hypothetical protein
MSPKEACAGADTGQFAGALPAYRQVTIVTSWGVPARFAPRRQLGGLISRCYRRHRPTARTTASMTARVSPTGSGSWSWAWEWAWA